eukprot:153132-Chlamydomonas_euryale.AAC.1
MPQGLSEAASRLPQRCPKAAPRMPGGCLEVALESPEAAPRRRKGAYGATNGCAESKGGGCTGWTGLDCSGPDSRDGSDSVEHRMRWDCSGPDSRAGSHRIEQAFPGRQCGRVG